MTSSASDARWFDENYFRHGCGQPVERSPEWLQLFAGIAERIVRDIEPRTVLDAGCAMGFLVESPPILTACHLSRSMTMAASLVAG